VQQPDESESDRLPDFVCIGGMRCGSTTLWMLLKSHPSVFMPDEKELHFFDRVERITPSDSAEYAANFRDASRDALLGEFTPSYLTRAGVAGRIADTLPNARLLVILRNPLDRAWSHYWFRVRRGTERLSFRRAVALEDRRRVPEPWRHAYIGWSRYAEHLRTYHDLFGPDRVHTLFWEDLAADPSPTMAAVARFLDIDPSVFAEGCDVPGSNSMTVPRSRLLYWATKNLESSLRGRGGPARLLHRALFRATAANQRRVRLPVPDWARARHAEWFGRSDAELARMLGRALPWAGAQ
tara:strand:+ start:9023 stop:9910 length:888 start_codon:yes stop_codon:yes gene_type:complete